MTIPPRRKRRTVRPAQIAKAIDEGRESLDLYLDEISKVPLLTREEEMELARKAFRGNVAAQEKLARHNVRFVAKLGFEVTRSGPRSIMLRTVPTCLPEIALAVLLRELWQTTQHGDDCATVTAALIAIITTRIQHATLNWDAAAVKLLLQETAGRDYDTLPASWLISTGQFSQWLAQQHRSQCN